MKRNIFIIIALAMFLGACETEFEQKQVVYKVRGLAQPYTVVYMDEAGASITEQVTPTSTDYTWSYTWSGEQGSILYFYMKYYDVNPPDDKFRMSILVDGKILRYADEYDKDDVIMKIDTTVTPHDTTWLPVFYVKRAGIIPY
jgi:hypothetical protein